MPIHGNAAVSYGNACLQSRNEPVPWIWDGLIAEDAVTLLSAPEKTGKTTLLSLLLDRRREGGQLLVAGHPAGVLLLHQTCAAGGRPRTRGPLRGFADILIDMEVPPGDRFTRRRRFCGVGRYPGTLQYVAAELNPEGTDYLLLPDEPPGSAPAPALDTLRQLLRESPAPL